MTPIEKISNQINNQEALKKIVRPTGITQEYTPLKLPISKERGFLSYLIF